MKKCIFIVVALCFCTYYCQKSRYCAVYARNWSTVSGVTLDFGLSPNGVWVHESIYLPVYPGSGMPVEKRSGFSYIRGDEVYWEVVREVGDTVIGSGTFIMKDMWLEVDGSNGDWTCTWSDEGW